MEIYYLNTVLGKRYYACISVTTAKNFVNLFEGKFYDGRYDKKYPYLIEI